jgi:hypothetical protein
MNVSPEYSTLVAVVITAVAGIALGWRRLARREFQRRLNTLEAVGHKYREQALSKLTPKVQVKIRLGLQNRARNMDAPAKFVRLVKWRSFFATTKGARFRDVLDIALIVFLFLGMFGGAFTGYFVSQHFASAIPPLWGLVFLEIGTFVALLASFELRSWVLDLAFRRYLAVKFKSKPIQT